MNDYFKVQELIFFVVVLRFWLKLYYIAKDGHELRTLLPLSLKGWDIRRSPQCPPHEVLGVELTSFMLAGQTLYQMNYMLSCRDLTFIFTLISPTLLQQKQSFLKNLKPSSMAWSAELYVCLFGC